MRLINADKLTADYIVASTTTNTQCYRYISKEQVENAPTVDAIPIEWLRNFQHFLYEEAEKISKEKDKNPMDTIGETWQFMSMSQAIDFTINKYGVENNLDKEIYGSEYIKMWGENE